MRPRSFLLLLAGIALALMAAGEADAGKEPKWNYNTGDGVDSVAISADGEYITAGGRDRNVYLFDKDSGTLLWSYTTGIVGDGVFSVAISADG
ncbi:MAG TPA: PQQ-binding-like beta-propeller repeat protein, partial [Candidatus Poseidoniia archaeon]|nr:PQQ-binding-like beta-propeller repeat protein [Candidatus Poseidoniia archaeon]